MICFAHFETDVAFNFCVWLQWMAAPCSSQRDETMLPSVQCRRACTRVIQLQQSFHSLTFIIRSKQVCVNEDDRDQPTHAQSLVTRRVHTNTAHTAVCSCPRSTAALLCRADVSFQASPIPSQRATHPSSGLNDHSLDRTTP